MKERYTLDFIGRECNVGDYVIASIKNTSGRGSGNSLTLCRIEETSTKLTCKVSLIIKGNVKETMLNEDNLVKLSGKKMSLDNNLIKHHPEAFL